MIKTCVKLFRQKPTQIKKERMKKTIKVLKIANSKHSFVELHVFFHST